MPTGEIKLNDGLNEEEEGKARKLPEGSAQRNFLKEHKSQKETKKIDIQPGPKEEIKVLASSKPASGDGSVNAKEPPKDISKVKNGDSISICQICNIIVKAGEDIIKCQKEKCIYHKDCFILHSDCDKTKKCSCGNSLAEIKKKYKREISFIMCVNCKKNNDITQKLDCEHYFCAKCLEEYLKPENIVQNINYGDLISVLCPFCNAFQHLSTILCLNFLANFTLSCCSNIENVKEYKNNLLDKTGGILFGLKPTIKWYFYHSVQITNPQCLKCSKSMENRDLSLLFGLSRNDYKDNLEKVKIEMEKENNQVIIWEQNKKCTNCSVTETVRMYQCEHVQLCKTHIR